MDAVLHAVFDKDVLQQNCITNVLLSSPGNTAGILLQYCNRAFFFPDERWCKTKECCVHRLVLYNQTG
jgi:hypothetical protein